MNRQRTARENVRNSLVSKMLDGAKALNEFFESASSEQNFDAQKKASVLNEKYKLTDNQRKYLGKVAAKTLESMDRVRNFESKFGIEIRPDGRKAFKDHEGVCSEFYSDGENHPAHSYNFCIGYTEKNGGRAFHPFPSKPIHFYDDGSEIVRKHEQRHCEDFVINEASGINDYDCHFAEVPAMLKEAEYFDVDDEMKKVHISVGFSEDGRKKGEVTPNLRDITLNLIEDKKVEPATLSYLFSTIQNPNKLTHRLELAHKCIVSYN